MKIDDLLMCFNLSAERMQSNNQENKQVYETCSEKFLNVAEKFDNNMKLIRNIEPDKTSMGNQLKKCHEELSNGNFTV